MSGDLVKASLNCADAHRQDAKRHFDSALYGIRSLVKYRPVRYR